MVKRLAVAVAATVDLAYVEVEELGLQHGLAMWALCLGGGLHTSPSVLIGSCLPSTDA